MTKRKTTVNSAKSKAAKPKSSSKKKPAVQYVGTPTVAFDSQITDAVTQAAPVSFWQRIVNWFKGA